MKMKNIFNNRKFKHGTAATVISLCFVAAIVLVNVIATMLADRLPLDVDLTASKAYELSDETKDFIKNLDREVELVVLAEKQAFSNAAGSFGSPEYGPHVTGTIEKYSQYSDKIKVRYVDLIKDPSLVAQYPELDLTSGDILVKSDIKSKKVNIVDLFNWDYNMSYQEVIASSKTENVLTGAIAGVVDENSSKAVFISGHDELDGAGLKGILSSNNFDASALQLATEDIPADVDFVIINAPSKDYTPDEIAKLDAFLENEGKLGKTILYFANYVAPELPNLEEFLAEWGIDVGAGMVYETDAKKVFNVNDPSFIAVEMDSTEYGEKLNEEGYLLTVPTARPLAPAFETRTNLKTSVLLTTSETSYLRPADADENYVPSKNDQQGPFGAAVKCEKTIGENKSVVVAFASFNVAEKSLLTSPIFNNGEYLASMLNTIAEKEVAINIVDKVVGAAQLSMNGLQVIIFTVLFMVIIPLTILIIGIVVWIKRRNR